MQGWKHHTEYRDRLSHRKENHYRYVLARGWKHRFEPSHGRYIEGHVPRERCPICRWTQLDESVHHADCYDPDGGVLIRYRDLAVFRGNNQYKRLCAFLDQCGSTDFGESFHDYVFRILQKDAHWCRRCRKEVAPVEYRMHPKNDGSTTETCFTCGVQKGGVMARRPCVPARREWMDHVIVERFFEFKQIVKLFERGSDSALPTAKLTLARWEIEDDECWSEDDPEADDHEIYEAARYY